MANITIKVRRSDVYPVGTVVKAFAADSRKHSSVAPASGTALTEATVDAAGVLTLTVPARTPIQLWAEVLSEQRYLRAGDPTSDAPLLGLSARTKRRRVETGALA